VQREAANRRVREARGPRPAEVGSRGGAVSGAAGGGELARHGGEGATTG
jgi:hypothetical protein